MRKTYLIVDGNSLGHRAQNMGGILTLGTMQVQAIYNFLQTLRGYALKHSMAIPIVLWDGIGWRHTRHIGYKSSREKTDTPAQQKQAEMRKHYQKQRPLIQQALGFLGVTQVQAQNMEADDLAAIMADLYADQGHLVTLLSEDRDWLQIIRNGVALERPVSKDRISITNFEEVTEVPTPAMYAEVKAMMGDRGDDIDPIGGIGAKRATELVKAYGSFHGLLHGVMIDKTIDPAGLPKYLRDLVASEEKALAFDFNMSLVDLRHPARPAVENMQINAGAPSDEHFRQFCETLLFNSFLNNFGDWIAPFPVGKTQALAA
ncbi:hypothetical protein [Paracoccus litorisediminis]|uniref:5'-3' exonuclease domain-containing protein n=1 Tax=Paracoccus litorisediminis TaxID=2006130 RepID=A0A844HRZ2_9RHOB|nr:hypothetical protein [Paracoccus litorisediminis]MTH61097.1 hypothetical protein [Paracoccus litorisediminis]